MEWVSLMPENAFSGIKADMLTASGGLMMLVIILLGIGIVIRVMSK